MVTRAIRVGTGVGTAAAARTTSTAAAEPGCIDGFRGAGGVGADEDAVAVDAMTATIISPAPPADRRAGGDRHPAARTRFRFRSAIRYRPQASRHAFLFPSGRSPCPDRVRHAATPRRGFLRATASRGRADLAFRVHAPTGSAA